MGPTRLSVHTGRIVEADGSRISSATVFCPTLGRSTEASVCQVCPRAEWVSSEVVVCAPSPELPQGDSAAAATAAARMMICLRGDVPGAMLASLAPRRTWEFPVVDEQEHFTGFVSSTAIASLRLPEGFVTAARAQDLAWGRSLSVPETEPLRSAVYTMAKRRVRVLALVDEEGRPQGVLSDVDALLALGKRGS